MNGRRLGSIKSMKKTISFARLKKNPPPYVFFFSFSLVFVKRLETFLAGLILLRVFFFPAYKKTLVDTVNLIRCSTSMIVFFFLSGTCGFGECGRHSLGSGDGLFF